jgi:hypothetical protein
VISEGVGFKCVVIFCFPGKKRGVRGFVASGFEPLFVGGTGQGKWRRELWKPKGQPMIDEQFLNSFSLVCF